MIPELKKYAKEGVEALRQAATQEVESDNVPVQKRTAPEGDQIGRKYLAALRRTSHLTRADRKTGYVSRKKTQGGTAGQKPCASGQDGGQGCVQENGWSRYVCVWLDRASTESPKNRRSAESRRHQLAVERSQSHNDEWTKQCQNVAEHECRCETSPS